MYKKTLISSFIIIFLSILLLLSRILIFNFSIGSLDDTEKYIESLTGEITYYEDGPNNPITFVINSQTYHEEARYGIYNIKVLNGDKVTFNVNYETYQSEDKKQFKLNSISQDTSIKNDQWYEYESINEFISSLNIDSFDYSLKDIVNETVKRPVFPKFNINPSVYKQNSFSLEVQEAVAKEFGIIFSPENDLESLSIEYDMDIIQQSILRANVEAQVKDKRSQNIRLNGKLDFSIKYDDFEIPETSGLPRD